ncbi:MAG: hypothetical protein HWN66_20855 [Candidatus Helarchaeota archaeon]|nr:hypothetical protein [Candidatus Helarchaeota archaeon]
MSEENKFKAIIQEIKEIFLFLTIKKPSSDEEIEARENLIKKFKELTSLNTIQELDEVIEDILNKLEDWDPFNFTFIGVRGLSDSIQKIIDVTPDKLL